MILDSIKRVEFPDRDTMLIFYAALVQDIIYKPNYPKLDIHTSLLTEKPYMTIYKYVEVDQNSVWLEHRNISLN